MAAENPCVMCDTILLSLIVWSKEIVPHAMALILHAVHAVGLRFVPKARQEKNVGGWKLHARWVPRTVSFFVFARTNNCLFFFHGRTQRRTEGDEAGQQEISPAMETAPGEGRARLRATNGLLAAPWGSSGGGGLSHGDVVVTRRRGSPERCAAASRRAEAALGSMATPRGLGHRIKGLGAGGSVPAAMVVREGWPREWLGCDRWLGADDGVVEQCVIAVRVFAS
jgi:hypothetical protein